MVSKSIQFEDCGAYSDWNLLINWKSYDYKKVSLKLMSSPVAGYQEIWVYEHLGDPLLEFKRAYNYIQNDTLLAACK